MKQTVKVIALVIGLILGSIILLLLVLFGAAELLWMMHPKEFRDNRERFANAYTGLSSQFGMTENQAASLFGREPIGKFELWGGQVLYFEDPMYANPPDSYARYFTGPANDMNDIPDIYSSAQLLFNRQGQLVAFTRNGEEVEIHTVTGDYPGANVRSLRTDVFRDLLAREIEPPPTVSGKAP